MWPVKGFIFTTWFIAECSDLVLCHVTVSWYDSYDIIWEQQHILTGLITWAGYYRLLHEHDLPSSLEP